MDLLALLKLFLAFGSLFYIVGIIFILRDLFKSKKPKVKKQDVAAETDL